MAKRKRKLFEVKFTKKHAGYKKGEKGSFTGPHASNLVRNLKVAVFVLSDKELRAQTKTAASADRIKKRKAAEKHKVTAEAKKKLVIAKSEADELRIATEEAKATVVDLEKQRDAAIKDEPAKVQGLKDAIVVAENKHSIIASKYYDAKLVVSELEEVLGIKKEEKTEEPPATDGTEEDLTKLPPVTK